ncbi:hypothetical protein EC973_005441 [Apophysomyces ossiformis]|uniref:MMS19 nucleotide excision repair protein n=1 Tax=Apophysomyces ossiformis TaxID=679940 RepID=A0A8H7ERJ1_9FUNG|nr:hypothetical protein EC973_005441 [Apophysomyces ossiformis]
MWSFVPPPNDPYKISTEDLKDSLRRCLAATPYFAYYATPLLIEKLLTSTGSAKKDAMDTIGLCAPSYGAHAVLPHANDIFDALVKEVYQASDLSMEKTALRTIHSVVATLGSGISIANIRDPVEKAIDRLLSQCVQNLKEPELKMAKSASYILRAAASASDPASTSVAQAAVPLLYQQFGMTDPPSKQKAILDIFIEILDANKVLYGSVEDKGYDRDFQTPLLAFKQQILQVFVLSLIQSATTDAGVRCSSLKGIKLMTLMKQFLTPEELLRQLPDSGNPSCVTYLETLECIDQLTTSATIWLSVAPALMNKLDLVCCTATSANLGYACALAASIRHTFETAPKDAEMIKLSQEALFPSIVSGCIRSTLRYPNSWNLNKRLMELLAETVAAIVRSSDLSYQKHLVDNAFQLFVDGDPSVVNVPSLPTSSVKILEWPQGLVNHSEVDTSLLFPAIIGNCRKDVELPVLSLGTFLQSVTRKFMESSCPSRHQALAKTAACIINKWSNDDVNGFLSTTVKTELLSTLSSSNTEDRERSLSIITWIAKALVVRGNSLGYELLDSIMIQCGSSDIGTKAAESFSVILQEDKLILNKRSYATISDRV